MTPVLTPTWIWSRTESGSLSPTSRPSSPEGSSGVRGQAVSPASPRRAATRRQGLLRLESLANRGTPHPVIVVVTAVRPALQASQVESHREPHRQGAVELGADLDLVELARRRDLDDLPAADLHRNRLGVAHV